VARTVRDDDVESGWRPDTKASDMSSNVSSAERLASLEARMDRMDDLHTLIVGLRGDMTSQFTGLRADMNRQFDLMNSRVDELRADMNRRFEQVDRRFDQVDRRFEQVESRFQQVDNRFQAFDVKVDRHFTWVIGIQMTLLLAVIGAMVGSYYR
jgi:SMC interacting uncharacterized protein involved in chromosome segregation